MSYSKSYFKTHSSKDALKAHIERIGERSGRYKVKGLTIEYQFPKKKLPQFVYDIVLWKGDKLVEKHTMKVRAAKQSTAKDKVVKKYQWPYFVELFNINDEPKGSKHLS